MTYEKKSKLLDKVIKNIREKTEEECIQVIPYTKEQTSVLQSNFFGVPYITSITDIPLNKNGEQLTLLAQINLTELPTNDLLPNKGLLQFWIDSNDDSLGIEWGEEEQKHIKNKIIYISEYKNNINIKDVQSIYQSKTNDMFPIDKTYLLKFKLTFQSITYSDYRFDSYIVNEWNKLIEKEEDKLSTIFDLEWDLRKELYAINEHIYNQIGGYPYFSQEDPRYNNEFDILLLQIDSQKTDTGRIMWGDCGICNFFINKEKLKHLNFSDFLYNWDCY